MTPIEDDAFGNLVLKNFQEITEPDVFHWLPLATGIYVLLAALAAFLVWKAFEWYKSYQANAYRREASKALVTYKLDFETGKLSTKNYLKAQRQLLKATALVAYPRAEVASLSDKQWMDYLNQRVAEPLFDDEISSLMGRDMYQADIDVSRDRCARLYAAITVWIDHHQLNLLDEAV